MDLNDGLRALHEEVRTNAGALSAATIAAGAHRRRTLLRTGYAAVSTGLVAAVVLGGVALADREPPMPPAVTETLAPTPTSTSSAAPTETPTAPAGVAWRPNLSRCGLAGDAWVISDQPYAGVWVGNYWGPDPVDSTDSWHTLSDAIWEEDHGGAAMTVEVLDAVVVPVDYSPVGELQVGDVVAVLGTQVAPFDVALESGSEGGGTGSHQSIDTRLALALCGDASALPDGEYTTVTRYRLTVDGQSVVLFGASEQLVGEAPAGPDDQGLWPVFDAPAMSATADLSGEVPACGSTYTLAEVSYAAEPTAPSWWLALMSGYVTPSGVDGSGPRAEYLWFGPLTKAWSGAPYPYGYAEPVAVMVRRSDGLVVARMDLQAVAQHEVAGLDRTPLAATGFPWGTVVAHAAQNLWWTPVGCADLGGDIRTGVAFDPGSPDVDTGYTLHVGQRVLWSDGSTRWYWTSRNRNDTAYPPS